MGGAHRPRPTGALGTFPGEPRPHDHRRCHPDHDRRRRPAGLAATVTRSEPPTLLEYTWGTDVLHWELAAIGLGAQNSATTRDSAAMAATVRTGTRLTLRHTVAAVS